MGIAIAISKGGGKSGKPWFGFPGFPRTVISTALPLLRFGSFLLFCGGPSEAVGLGAGLQDVSPVSDAIKQRFAQSGVRDHLRPLGKRQVRREYNGGLLGSLSHDLE